MRRHSWLTDSDLETIDNKEADSETIHEQLTHLNKRERHAQQTISEFIQTERRHVKKLKVLKYMYKVPICKETFLTNDEIELIFRNIDDLLELHSEYIYRITHYNYQFFV